MVTFKLHSLTLQIRKIFRVLSVPIILIAVLYYLSIKWLEPISAINKNKTTLHKTLIVYTYSSFMNSWGPGPKLKFEFEKRCNCQVQFVNVGESAMIAQRLILEKNQNKEQSPDMVVGLDLFAIEETKKIEWLSLEDIDTKITMSNKWDNDLYEASSSLWSKFFLPYDWSPMTFIFRKDEIAPPHSLNDLLDQRFQKSITLADPRLSSPGYQFLLWLFTLKGEDAWDYLKNLKEQIHSISPSWSMSYGLFQKKQSKLTFSYITSPVYHWLENKDFSYQPIVFNDVHIYQVELMGILKNCNACEIAKSFLKFLLEPESQKIIMNYNYMLPVISGIDKGEFNKLPRVALVPNSKLKTILHQRNRLLEQWKKTQQH